jgi:filamentous hemagglutinin
MNETNPAHQPGPSFNPRKTPEPVDAAQVYKNAIRTNIGEYYGTNAKGEIYRFYSNNAGTIHFSGIIPEGDVNGSILRQLNIK